MYETDESALDAATLKWVRELAPIGVVTTDCNLVLRWCNHWFEQHSGERNLTGQPLIKVFPDLVTRGLDRYFHEALSGATRVLSQRLHGYLFPMKSAVPGMKFGAMQQNAQIAPLLHEGAVIGTITLIEDVTERVIHEGELQDALGRERRARVQAEEASRLKDEFLATVSHEIRTPLNSIIGWSHIIKNQNLCPSAMEHAVDVIERNAKVQAQLVEDLLDMSRIMRGKVHLEVQPTDLQTVIDAAIESLGPAARNRQIKLNVELEPRLMIVRADPGRIQQVIWNLVSNAIKFTPPGGRVDVLSTAVNSGVRIIVRDSGVGISPEFLPHMFERFRQADAGTTRKYHGLGLGLAIVRELVALHGGTVWAESAGEGLGATLVVDLPNCFVDPTLAVTDEVRKSARRDAATLQGLQILLVDDEPDALEVTREVLAGYGARVIACDSAAAALDYAKQSRPDVLVADIAMPGEDGYSLIAKMRAWEHETQRVPVPALALTAYSRPEDRTRLVRAGFQAHAAKPADPEELAEAVATLVNAVLPVGSDRSV